MSMTKKAEGEAVKSWKESYRLILEDRDEQKARAEAAIRANLEFSKAGEEMQRRVDDLKSKLAEAEKERDTWKDNATRVGNMLEDSLAIGAALAERREK